MKIVILGAGQVGRTVAYQLCREEANEVTVVDVNGDILRDLQDRIDIRTVAGNGAFPSVLEAAGAAEADILIALTMMVMEKTRDIAVMMSFGVSDTQVRRIFMLQGLLISTIGTALGLALGYAASIAGSHFRFIHLDASVYSIDYLPFAPRLTDALIVAGVSLGISLLATLYPSNSAARILPAEALRYE